MPETGCRHGSYVMVVDGGAEMKGHYMTMLRKTPDGDLEAAYDAFSPSTIPTWS